MTIRIDGTSKTYAAGFEEVIRQVHAYSLNGGLAANSLKKGVDKLLKL